MVNRKRKGIRTLTALLVALLGSLPAWAQAQQPHGEQPHEEPPPEEPGEVRIIGESEFTGTVVEVEVAEVANTGVFHKVVLLDTGPGGVVVDLGPVDELQDVEVEQGSELSVEGTLVQVADHPFLVATLVEVQDQRIEIEREMPEEMEEP